MKRLLFCLLWLPAIAAADPSMKGQILHLFDLVTLSADVCTAPGAQVYVSSDDGTILTVSIDAQGNLKFPLPAACSGGYAQQGTLYSVPKAALANERLTSQSWVAGILTVPFKFHLSSDALTPGGTFAPYVGYRTSVFNALTITPIAAAGLTLVSTQPIGAKSPQTATGFSIASGFIGTVGATGMQYGVIFGWDWVGRSAQYQYEGKPWLALEVGYAFAQ